MSRSLVKKTSISKGISEELMDFEVQYRDDIVNVFGEDVVRRLESLHKGICYVPQAGTGKAVITGPFQSLIRGVLIGVMLEKKKRLGHE